MKKSTVLMAGAVLVAASASTALWWKTRSIDAAVAERYGAALRGLQRRDRTLNQDVLRARFRLIHTYDPLVATGREIEASLRFVSEPPEFVIGDERRALEREIARYTEVLDRKREDVEAFKMRNSVLRNSLRYLPTLIAETVERAASAEGGGVLAARLRTILERVLVYNLTSDQALRAAIDADLELLSREADETLRLDLVVRHVRTILEAKPEVDAIVQRIFEEPVAEHEDRVAAAYARGRAAAERSASRYRVALWALTFSLALLICYAFYRLRQAMRKVAHMNATLERRVFERTRELDERNGAMRLVLDNVEQGFLTVDRDGRTSHERSAIVDRWMPGVAGAASIWEALSELDPSAAEWIEIGWSSLFDDVLPLEVAVAQLPTRATDGARHFSLEYTPIFAGRNVSRVLVVLTDVTSRVERERSANERRDLLSVLEHVGRDRAGLAEFRREASALVGRILDPGTDRSEVLRAAHTLEGNAGMLGMATLAEACDAIETKLGAGDALDEDDRARLHGTWSSFEASTEALLGGAGERLEVSVADYERILGAADRGADRAELLRMLRRLRFEPAERRLARVARQVRSVGKRLDKDGIRVIVEANDVRFDVEKWSTFWSTFVHVVRNAVDHGIEPRTERTLLGKPETGTITLRTAATERETIVEISDDGRGIDWAAVERRSRELGLDPRCPEDVFEALFVDGLSTRAEVREVSGRGVGMGAVRRAVEDLSGRIAVHSRVGGGTTVHFAVPHEPPGSGACSISERAAL